MPLQSNILKQQSKISKKKQFTHKSLINNQTNNNNNNHYPNIHFYFLHHFTIPSNPTKSL